MTSTSATPLEFKGRMLGISVLRVTDNDLERVRAALDDILARDTGLLRELPVVLDLDVQIIDVAGLAELLRKQHIAVLGALRGAASMEQAVRHAGLPVLRDPSGAARPRAEAPAAVEAPAPEPAEAGGRPAAMIVSTPVRSGQRVYARGTDLIVINAVSPGAEVIADGCVHVYGTLRGRAIAGAQGDEAAQIFCSDLQAELLAIAGRYKVADDIPEAVRKRAVRVGLNGEKLDIGPLDT